MRRSWRARRGVPRRSAMLEHPAPMELREASRAALGVRPLPATLRRSPEPKRRAALSWPVDCYIHFLCGNAWGSFRLVWLSFLPWLVLRGKVKALNAAEHLFSRYRSGKASCYAEIDG